MNEHLYGLIYTEWVDILGVANVTDRERYEILRYLIYEYVKLNHGIENPYEMPRGNAEPTARVLRDNLVRVHSAYARKKPHARTEKNKNKNKIDTIQKPLRAYEVVSPKAGETTSTPDNAKLYEIGLQMLSQGLRVDASEMIRANLNCEKLQELGRLRKSRVAYLFGTARSRIDPAIGAEYSELLKECGVTSLFAQEVEKIHPESGVLIIECSKSAADEICKSLALSAVVETMASRRGCEDTKIIVRSDIWMQ